MTTLPVQTDTELAELNYQAAGLKRTIAHVVASFHHVVGDRKTTVYGRRVWGLTDEEAEDRAANGVGVAPYELRTVAADFATRDKAQAELDAVRARIAELNAIFRAHGGWSRFFLVQGGHIHSSMECSTCNNGHLPTEFGWLPELSGLTEAEAVAAHGAILCTVCFPSAPVEWTNKYELEEAAKQAAKCPGSGKMYDPAQPHQTRQMSKWGYCTSCGSRQTLSSLGNIRAHKKA